MDAATRTTEATTVAARGRRRAPVWALVVGAVALGVAVGLILPQLAAPRVVAHLSPMADTSVEFPFETVTVEPTTLVRYDDFDDMRVWSGRNEEGSQCLFVALSLRWLDLACAPGELDPTVNVNVDVRDDSDAAGVFDRPIGSLVRFVLRDGVVEVWVAETAEQYAFGP